MPTPSASFLTKILVIEGLNSRHLSGGLMVWPWKVLHTGKQYKDNLATWSLSWMWQIFSLDHRSLSTFVYSVPGQSAWILHGYDVAQTSSHLVSSWLCWTWSLGNKTERQERKQSCLLTRFLSVVFEWMATSLYQKSEQLLRGSFHTSIPNAGSANWILHSSL